MKNSNKQKISSPCVSMCGLNAEDICEGCFRSANEIRRWGAMSEEEKKLTRQIAYEREKKVNPFL